MHLLLLQGCSYTNQVGGDFVCQVSMAYACIIPKFSKIRHTNLLAMTACCGKAVRLRISLSVSHTNCSQFNGNGRRQDTQTMCSGLSRTNEYLLTLSQYLHCAAVVGLQPCQCGRSMPLHAGRGHLRCIQSPKSNIQHGLHGFKLQCKLLAGCGQLPGGQVSR